jgi:hypothetical protein
VTDAILYHGSGEGRALEVGGDLVLFRASRDEGFGSLFIELTCPPGGGPPPHTDPLGGALLRAQGRVRTRLAGTGRANRATAAGRGQRVRAAGRTAHVPECRHATGPAARLLSAERAHARLLRRTRRPSSRAVYLDLLRAAAARASDRCGKALGDWLRGPAAGAVAAGLGRRRPCVAVLAHTLAHEQKSACKSRLLQQSRKPLEVTGLSRVRIPPPPPLQNSLVQASSVCLASQEAAGCLVKSYVGEPGYSTPPARWKRLTERRSLT